ncbi:MAG: hypothetical protein HOE90_16415 [Bacteriovoracaceae bacterium]|jgi:hypothetical protein|nr:hypothetical protein [Bacteriovoracaceae bacterium]
MTLGQCLEEIRHVYLGGNLEKMTKVGMFLIRDIKKNHYPAGDFPRHGWLVRICDTGPSVSNGDVSIGVDLSPKNKHRPIVNKPAPEAKAFDSNYYQKVLQLRKEAYRRGLL